MRNKILMIVSFLALILGTDSCLKDNVGMDWTSDLKGKMYAEVWKGGFLALGLSPVPDPVTFRLLVNIATDQPPTEDITVTLAVNDAARVQYNTLNKKAYLLYPYIQILDPTVVIKAGTRNAYCRVKIWNANLLSACDNFMAPISIMTASGGVIVADPVNNGSRLMALPISNPYQGDYHATGVLHHPTNGDFVVDDDFTLGTIDCKTVGTTVGITGAGQVTFTVNADNSVTIGGAYSDTQPVTAVTGKPNVYDPVAHTFTVNYKYPGSGGDRVYDVVYTKL